ncbi:LysR family transcriptional regulator [Rhodobacteraceae bacterium M382]|nr:LysR family transcriptional regulator [Rhodobacteraceae bacterium M382]
MPRARRFTPPMSWLSAFETVARLGSVTDAAREMDLTQGAVSRQVQKLEDAVQVPLFQRDRKRMMLTPQGAAYAEQVRAAVNQIAAATIALQANPLGGALNLAILPAFGAHWLAPRLPGFLQAHPGITLNLGTRTDPFDFTQETFHGAIHFGQDDWPDTEALKLWDEQVVAVMSPDLEVADMESLSHLPRLQLASRPWAWDQWFSAQGLVATGAPAMVLDQFATMAQAAQSGLGVALMPDYLVGKDLQDGRLIAMPGAARVSVGSYYLVWPRAGRDYPALQALRDWLTTLCKET